MMSQPIDECRSQSPETKKKNNLKDEVKAVPKMNLSALQNPRHQLPTP